MTSELVYLTISILLVFAIPFMCYFFYRYGYAVGHADCFDKYIKKYVAAKRKEDSEKDPLKPKKSIAETLTSLMGDNHDVYYPDEDIENQMRGTAVKLPFD